MNAVTNVARVTIAGDEAAVACTGSSGQENLALNTVMNYTLAYSAYALKLCWRLGFAIKKVPFFPSG